MVEEEKEEEDSIISHKAAGHLSSSNVAAHLVVVRTGWHWYAAFEAGGKRPGPAYCRDRALAPSFCLL